MMYNKKFFDSIKIAKENILNLTDDQINKVLKDLQNEIIKHKNYIITENKADLDLFKKKFSLKHPNYDRLKLEEKNIANIVNDLKEVQEINFSVENNLISEWSRQEKKLKIKEYSVPIGSVLAIYESRPNVTIDLFALCFKTQNVCLLKGGREAFRSNTALIKIIHQVLKNNNIDENIVHLISIENRDDLKKILKKEKSIDLCIARGGKKLIEFVKKNSKIPFIETGASPVHLYFDKAGDLEIGKKIILNSKIRKVSVCNALDLILINTARLPDAYLLLRELEKYNVIIYADKLAYQELHGKYKYLEKFEKHHKGEEFLDYKLAIITVKNEKEALNYIQKHSLQHTECVVSQDQNIINYFIKYLDTAAITINTSTGFIDGNQFGFGSEIGISTQKLHARGPMGLKSLRTIKYVLLSDGLIRN